MKSFSKKKDAKSISSKAFCSITDRQTDKIFTEWMLKGKMNLHRKNRLLYQLGAEKITFSPKHEIQTYGQTLVIID